VTIDQLLDRIREHLHLSKETETEIIAEIRAHLEDSLAAAVANGEDEQAALMKVAEKFGLAEAGAELQETHANREAIEAILAVALPVLFALALRWAAFSPAGSQLAWARLWTQPGFWTLAAAALLIPAFWLRRWRLALLGWGIFWLLTVIFVVFPSSNNW